MAEVVTLFDPKIIFHDSVTGRNITITITDEYLQNLLISPGNNIIELNLSYERVDVDLMGQVIYVPEEVVYEKVDKLFKTINKAKLPYIVKPRYNDEISTGELLSSTFTPCENTDLRLLNVIWDFSYYPDFSDENKPKKNPPSIIKEGTLGRLAYSAIVDFNVDGKLYVRLSHEFRDNSTEEVLRVSSLPKVLYFNNYEYVEPELPPVVEPEPDPLPPTIPDNNPSDNGNNNNNPTDPNSPTNPSMPARTYNVPFMFKDSKKQTSETDMKIIELDNCRDLSFYNKYWLSGTTIVGDRYTINENNWNNYITLLRKVFVEEFELCLKYLPAIEDSYDNLTGTISFDFNTLISKTGLNKYYTPLTHKTMTYEFNITPRTYNVCNPIKYSYCTNGLREFLKNFFDTNYIPELRNVFVNKTVYPDPILSSIYLTINISFNSPDIMENSYSIDLGPRLYNDIIS